MMSIQLPEEAGPIETLVHSLLACISVIISSVANIVKENENFMEFGCYLYRVSPVIMELHMKHKTSPDLVKVIESVFNKVDFAKDLVEKCNADGDSVTCSQIKSTIELLQGVTRNIGEDLNSVPSSIFRNQRYVTHSMSLLSREMKNAKFNMTEVARVHHEDVLSQENPVLENEKRMADHTSISSKEVCRSQSPDPDSKRVQVPCLGDFLRGMHYSENDNVSQTFGRRQQKDEYIDPLYDSFFCPLTRKMMEDPVTVDSGMTYERKAIKEWFKRFENSLEDIVCPTTGQKLETRILRANRALKATIEEWKERNETTRIKVARSTLTSNSSKSLMLEAMRDLQLLSQKKKYSKVQMRSLGFIELLAQFLEHEDKEVRCKALETSTLLVEDEEGKEMVPNTRAIAVAVRMLTSDDALERDASVSFLLEISKSEMICQKIGSVTGGVLMLTTVKYNTSIEASTVEKARKTLKNLEKCPKNIKCMAENGDLEPLLNNLIDGSEEVQIEMARFLGELFVVQGKNELVAERASGALIKMVHNENILIRKAAVKALVHISSHLPSGRTLVEAGAVQVMIEEMFASDTYNKQLDSKEKSALILANILKSIQDPETLQVDAHGHTMGSESTIKNFVHMLHHTMPDELNLNIIKILMSLMEFQRLAARIVKAISESDASYMVIEFLNSQHEELSIASIKLFIKLAPHMGYTIAERLFKIRGQPESLIMMIDTGRITEKQAVSAELLANLPCQNLVLNLVLLHKGMVQIVLHNIYRIQRGGIRSSKYARAYLEGLVGILERFTTTLYDQKILNLAREYDLTTVFMQLLSRTTGSDETQRLAAIGLQNLSKESINLSKPPVAVKKPSISCCLPRFCCVRSSQVTILQLCPVHKGACSPSTTFCLLESKAIERLVGCLEHENGKVVEAALSAICTLLDDKVDVQKSVNILSEINAVQYVLNIFKEHREEEVLQKSFWLIEKFLLRGGPMFVNEIYSNRLLASVLVTAHTNGGSNTKKLADNILRYLKKIPDTSFSFNR